MFFPFRKSVYLGNGFRLYLSKSGPRVGLGRAGFLRSLNAVDRALNDYDRETNKVKKAEKARKAATSEEPDEPLLVSFYNFLVALARFLYACLPLRAFKSPIEFESVESIKTARADKLGDADLEETFSAARASILLDRFANVAIGTTALLTLALVIAAFRDATAAHRAANAFAVLFLLLLFALSIVWKIFVRRFCRVEFPSSNERALTYEERRFARVWNDVTRSGAIWRAIKRGRVDDARFRDASRSKVCYVRRRVSLSRVPFPFRSDAERVALKSGRETFVFFPNYLLVVQGRRIGVIKPSDFALDVRAYRLPEAGSTPPDAFIFAKDGRFAVRSDRRNSNSSGNRNVPLCEYSLVDLKSPSGLNVVLICSKHFCNEL